MVFDCYVKMMWVMQHSASSVEARRCEYVSFLQSLLPQFSLDYDFR